MPLPAPPAVADIHERLQAIFPEGTANRNYVTREIAAKTVFVMLYIGAVEGTERWLRPDQVMRMTDAQAALPEEQGREGWLAELIWFSACICGKHAQHLFSRPIKAQPGRGVAARHGVRVGPAGITIVARDWTNVQLLRRMSDA